MCTIQSSNLWSATYRTPWQKRPKKELVQTDLLGGGILSIGLISQIFWHIRPKITHFQHTKLYIVILHQRLHNIQLFATLDRVEYPSIFHLLLHQRLIKK